MAELNRSIKLILFRDLALVLGIIILLVWSLIYIRDLTIREEISKEYISRVTVSAVDSYHRFTAPIENSLNVIRQWGAAGLLPINEDNSLSAKFIPLLNQLRHASGLVLADENKAEFVIDRLEDGWMTRLSSAKNKPGIINWTQRTTQGDPVKSWETISSTDPTLQTWFNGALDSVPPDSIYWSRPHRSSADGNSLLTAAISWTATPINKIRQVLALNIRLAEVFRITSQIKITPQSKTFIFDGQGKMFNPLSDKIYGDSVKTGLFISPEMVDDQIISRTLMLWADSRLDNRDPLNFEFAKKVYWAGFEQLNNDRYQLWLGVVIPEEDLWGTIADNRQIMLIAIVFVLLLGSGLAFLIIKRYRRSYRNILHAAEPGRIVDLIAAGEGPGLEFKSTMRMNLKSGQNGKEIELAWLKTLVAFMNTDGGTLLIGVADNGEIIGTEPDQFQNDDKCHLHFKNLIKQHIGTEYARYINMKIVPINDKKVMVIQITRSGKPVFLRVRSDEELFYIRSGPASEKLLPSQILRYMESREQAK